MQTPNKPLDEMEVFAMQVFLASLGCPNGFGLPPEPRKIALVKSIEQEALEDTLMHFAYYFGQAYPTEVGEFTRKVFLINRVEEGWLFERLDYLLNKPLFPAPLYPSLKGVLDQLPSQTLVLFLVEPLPEWEDLVRGYPFTFFSYRYPRLR